VTNPSTPALRRKLREAPRGELDRLLEAEVEALDPPALRQLFRNPFLDGRLIEELFEQPGVDGTYEARREAAVHPQTPRLLALRFVPTLHWLDLVRVGLDTRLHPVVRRAADLRLIERLPRMAVGEKVAIARQASPAVLAALRHDPTPAVIAALLDNPRTTELLLLPLAASESASPQALGVVASNPRWACRPALRAALCKNPALALPLALALLPGLAKRDLRAIAMDGRLALALRRKAGLLGSAGTAEPRRPSGD
jgi:hypothetical protein